MSQPNKPGKGKKALLAVAAIFSILLFLISVVYYNNSRQETSIVDYNTIRDAADTVAILEKNIDPPENSKPDGKNSKSIVKRNISIGPIVCSTSDSGRQCLQVGIRLSFDAGPLDREIEEKQENIIRLIKFVFINKTVAEINAEKARTEILDKINSFLSTGKTSDLIFTVFDIIPMEIK
jgi:flagellar basal body-associated protein FliL